MIRGCIYLSVGAKMHWVGYLMEISNMQRRVGDSNEWRWSCINWTNPFNNKSTDKQTKTRWTWTSSGEASLPLSSSNNVSILSPLVARNLLKNIGKILWPGISWNILRMIVPVSCYRYYYQIDLIWSISLSNRPDFIFAHISNLFFPLIKRTWYYLCPCYQQNSSTLPGLADVWSARKSNENFCHVFYRS